MVCEASGIVAAATTTRYVVGWVFLVAGIGKLRNPEAIVASLNRMQWFRTRWHPVHGRALGIIELSIGLGLIVDGAPGLWLAVALAVLAAFSLVIVHWGDRLSNGCGCFGPAWDRYGGKFDGIRNTILITSAGSSLLIHGACYSWAVPPLDWDLRLSSLAAAGLATLLGVGVFEVAFLYQQAQGSR